MIFTEYKNFKIFESNNKIQNYIKKFKNKWGTDLDPNLTISQIKLIEKAFNIFDTKFLKNRIKKIVLRELGGIHGEWRPKYKDEYKHRKEGFIYLNPNIFKFKKKFSNDISYKDFIIIHEIGHCIDHIERISYSKEWQSISGWKKCDINKKIPKGYARYIEKRKGRGKHKKSNWVYKIDADFTRRYTSRNPREDFADCFAFGIFGLWDKFKGEGGKRKMDIIKKVMKISN